MKVLRLKYFSKKKKEDKKNYVPGIVGGLGAAASIGGTMAGIEKVDRDKGVSKRLDTLLGIKREDETLLNKIKRKSLDVIGGPKIEDEDGIVGSLKNKLKRKFAAKDLSTFRGSDEFMKPLEQTLKEYEDQADDSKRRAKKIEKQAKKNADNAIGQAAKNNAEYLRNNAANLLESEEYVQAKGELDRLKKLQRKGKVARDYTEAMNWMRSNWNKGGVLGKAKVAAIPVGAGASVGYGIHKLANRKKNTKE